MIWILLMAVVAILIWLKFIRPMSYFTRIGVKQTNPWPIFGDQWPAILRQMSNGELALWLYNMYPKCRYSGFYHFGAPALMLKDPELIKHLTVKEFEHFTDHRAFADPELDPIWSGNLFALKAFVEMEKIQVRDGVRINHEKTPYFEKLMKKCDVPMNKDYLANKSLKFIIMIIGLKWKEMRYTLSGTFTSSKIKHMFDTINEEAEKFVDHFIRKDQDLLEVELKDSFTRYTNDVIASAAFGIKVDSMGEPDNIFYHMGKRLTSFAGALLRIKMALLIVMPTVAKVFKLSLFKKELIEYFRGIIHEAVHTREEKGIIRKDMINLLLETRKGLTHEDENVTETGYATVKESTYLDKFKSKNLRKLTDDDITSQALIFFFAGFDTISTALCFGCYELALNKNVQNRLREEILESNKETNGKLSYDTLSKMKYMDQVFSEILRKWPPVPIIDRICTKPYKIEPKYEDEKPVPLNVGDMLILPMFGLHRNPKYFPKPEEFDPERFSDENKAKIVPYSYIPFGSGPRNCIGSRFAILEAKTVLYHLLLKFEIVPIKKTQIPLKLAKNTLQHTADGGFWLGLKKIKS